MIYCMSADILPRWLTSTLTIDYSTGCFCRGASLLALVLQLATLYSSAETAVYVSTARLTFSAKVAECFWDGKLEWTDTYLPLTPNFVDSPSSQQVLQQQARRRWHRAGVAHERTLLHVFGNCPRKGLLQHLGKLRVTAKSENSTQHEYE